MVEVESTVDRRDGVTLVAAVVANDRATTQRVTLRSRLEGPVWPPRRKGVVAPEWDGETWRGILEPNVRRGVGFATEAPPVDEPIELLENRRSRDDERAGSRARLAEPGVWFPSRIEGGPP